MARGPHSYFGRMVWGGGSAELRPSRPVSNLWKSARMEAPAENAVEPRVETPAHPARRAMVAPEAEIQTPMASTVEVRRERRGAGPARPVRTVERAPDVVARRQELAPREPGPRDVPGQERPASVAMPDAVQQERLSSEFEAASLDKKPARKSAAEFPPQLEPVRVREQVAQVKAERVRTEETATAPEGKGGAAAATPLERLSPMRAAPLRIEETARPRERVMREAPPQESPKNSVQIGKIEVQVVSPPAPVRYVAAPAAPKGRLARGYTLWSAWQ